MSFCQLNTEVLGQSVKLSNCDKGDVKRYLSLEESRCHACNTEEGYCKEEDDPLPIGSITDRIHTNMGYS